MSFYDEEILWWGLPWCLSGKKIHLSMQEAEVAALDLGGSHMPGVTKPLCHNKNHQNEKLMHCSWRVALLDATREKSMVPRRFKVQPKIIN